MRYINDIPSMKQKETRKLLGRSWLIAIVILTILMASIWIYTNYKAGLWEKDVRLNVHELLSTKKSNLEKALYSRIYYTRGVAAYVSLNPQITRQEYAQLAKEYIRNDTVINSMALSKDCILSDIYPLEGHESALGLNLLEHPERKTIVQKTIATHETFIAGPLELVEGGIAFVSYTPIFDKVEHQSEHFWGLTDIVILQDPLFNEAGLLPQEGGFNFALCGANGTGLNNEVFWGQEDIFDTDPVVINIELPIGTWVMAASPTKGWEHYANQDNTLLTLLIISAFVISILIGLFANALFQLHLNEKELKAIFASLDSLIMEMSEKGDYLKIVKTNSRLLYLPEEKLLGKKLEDIFDEEITTQFMTAISQCVQTKELVIIEYPLIISGNECWFSAHISYKSDQSIIFNASEITQSKAREKELQELNSTKDTFLSIIAHDLRGPLSSQQGLINVLLSNYDKLSDARRTLFLKSLQESSTHIYNLLENLLKWTMSQSGKIVMKPVDIKLKEKYQEMILQLQRNAALKNIVLTNAIDSRHSVVADANLTEVILRNLVSNAIKFTPKAGTITLSSKCVSINDADYIKVSVEDTGVGISEEKLKQMFSLKTKASTRGTDDEQGSGLGLILCKEFTDKQGGIIEISSEEGKGSKFSFALPRSSSL